MDIWGRAATTATKVNQNFPGRLNMTKSNTKKQFNFDLSLKQLEKIVAKMEEDDLPLEESIKLFEEGMKLSKTCQAALKEAEGKIKKLSQQGDALVEFEEESEKNNEAD